MLCIFNPEHDLCLANGSPHFVPPASALLFARLGSSIMQTLYPDALTLSTEQITPSFVQQWLQSGDSTIVPWGWNTTLVAQLLKNGIPRHLMPDDQTLDRYRSLQHRTTLLPLQPDSIAVQNPRQIEQLLSTTPHLVLKAPWSGSGRGLRFISFALTPLDLQWLKKIIASQRCVIAEPRRQVQADFALEYHIHDHTLQFIGYSLFQSEQGVYRANLLLPDPEIEQIVSYTPAMKSALENWLLSHIAPFYNGPLGVDHILTTQGTIHISELNLRHTMGLVAHQYLALHPESNGMRLTLRNHTLALIR